MHHALQKAWSFVQELNKYIDSHKPWVLAKENPERLAYVLYNLREGLRCASILLSPFIPETAEKVCDRLGVPLGELKDCVFGHGESNIHKGAVLFVKHEEIEEMVEEKPEVQYVPYDDFAKLDIRVGTVATVEEHPKADKLYVLLVDFGDHKRQVVAGIRNDYAQNELVGRQICVTCNLQPAKIRGVESQGMLLGAEESNGKYALLKPDRDVEKNSKVH